MVAYLKALDLEAYLGAYDRREVVVLADSGYDDKKIEQAIAQKGWNFIIALGKTRSVKSDGALSEHPVAQLVPRGHIFPPSSQAQAGHRSSIDEWEQTQSERTFASDTPRATCAMGKVELVCSERRNRPDGRRKYLACNDSGPPHARLSRDTACGGAWSFCISVKQHIGSRTWRRIALMRWYRMSTGSIVPTSCFTCHHRDSPRKARALVTDKERS